MFATVPSSAPAAVVSDFPAVGTLMTVRAAIDPFLSVNEVGDLFLASDEVDAMAVVHEGWVIGVLTRQKLLAKVFRRFGWEIFGRHPVFELLEGEPLVIPFSTPLDCALHLALGRRSADVYDDIAIVGDDGHYAGLLAVKQMVLEQTDAVATIMFQREVADERARELEKISEIKSQFLANVTHELRSPVNAIIELTDVMRTSLVREDVQQAIDRLQLLYTTANNLRDVITNMLDLSKIEAGRMTLIEETFLVADVLQEVADMTRLLIGNKPVQIVVEIEDPSLEMHTDPVKLRQILLNLTSNAAKFTDRGIISLEQRRRNDQIELTVSDTGIGMREDDLDRIFEAFTQLEDAHTKSHGGTGLGLAITRQLVDLLGGRIVATSQFGTGSRFSLTLPLDRLTRDAAKGDFP